MTIHLNIDAFLKAYEQPVSESSFITHLFTFSPTIADLVLVQVISQSQRFMHVRQ